MCRAHPFPCLTPRPRAHAMQRMCTTRQRGNVIRSPHPNRRHSLPLNRRPILPLNRRLSLHRNPRQSLRLHQHPNLPLNQRLHQHPNLHQVLITLSTDPLLLYTHIQIPFLFFFPFVLQPPPLSCSYYPLIVAFLLSYCFIVLLFLASFTRAPPLSVLFFLLVYP